MALHQLIGRVDNSIPESEPCQDRLAGCSAGTSRFGLRPAPSRTGQPATSRVRSPSFSFDSDKRHTVEVVGESAYQGTLERIAGGRTVDGCRDRDHTSVLLPEPTNRYDSHAVRVVVIPWGPSKGSGLVGYLAREDAVAYRPVIDRLAEVGRLAACAASLKGGWDQGGGDRGHIGVRLHIDTPAGALKELEADPECLRPVWEAPG